MTDAMYLNAFDRFLQDPNISMNPLNVVAAFSKNSVLPLSIFYRNHGYNTFVLLDNSDESKQISTQLAANDFSKVQTIFFEQVGKTIQSIPSCFAFSMDFIMELVFPNKSPTMGLN